MVSIGINTTTKGLTKEEWLEDRLTNHRAADGKVIEQSLADGRWLRISETKTRSGRTAGIRADITEMKTAKAQAEAALQEPLPDCRQRFLLHYRG